MKFILEIETGNDAMLKGADISEALIRVGKGLNPDFLADQPTGKRKILDLNGNTVGFYQIAEIGFPQIKEKRPHPFFIDLKMSDNQREVVN